MPFTPSHAVVALPFLRTPLLPAAIAVGAMTPDLPLFLRGTPLTYQATHTNVALSAAIALVLLAAWYLLFRPAVRELAPVWLAERLPGEWDTMGAAALRSVRSVRPGARSDEWRTPGVFAVAVAISLVLGVLSHIVWDAFTHEGRWGVRMVPALAQMWGPLPGYKWVQHGTSIFGLVVLAVFGVVWLSGRRPASVRRLLPAGVRTAWWVSLPLILIAAWVWGLVAYGPITDSWTVQHLAYRVLPPACAVWGVLTLVLCVVVIARRRPAA